MSGDAFEWSKEVQSRMLKGGFILEHGLHIDLASHLPEKLKLKYKLWDQMSYLADTVVMCWSLALIWSVDHAGANYRLLTYTSWPLQTGLFSITTEIRLQLLFLVRGTAWHLQQVRTIMPARRKSQPPYFPHCVDGRVESSDLWSCTVHCAVLWLFDYLSQYSCFCTLLLIL